MPLRAGPARGVPRHRAGSFRALPTRCHAAPPTPPARRVSGRPRPRAAPVRPAQDHQLEPAAADRRDGRRPRGADRAGEAGPAADAGGHRRHHRIAGEGGRALRLGAAAAAHPRPGDVEPDALAAPARGDHPAVGRPDRPGLPDPRSRHLRGRQRPPVARPGAQPAAIAPHRPAPAGAGRGARRLQHRRAGPAAGLPRCRAAPPDPRHGRSRALAPRPLPGAGLTCRGQAVLPRGASDHRPIVVHLEPGNPQGKPQPLRDRIEAFRDRAEDFRKRAPLKDMAAAIARRRRAGARPSRES